MPCNGCFGDAPAFITQLTQNIQRSAGVIPPTSSGGFGADLAQNIAAGLLNKAQNAAPVLTPPKAPALALIPGLRRKPTGGQLQSGLAAFQAREAARKTRTYLIAGGLVIGGLLLFGRKRKRR